MHILEVKLVRHTTGDMGTFGTLYIDDEAFCVTGELPYDSDYDGVTNESRRECIPTGVYHCRYRHASESASFSYDHYILEDVPDRSYILIHKGNFCGAEPQYRSDVAGCIILGTHVATIQGQTAVISSSIAFNKFMDYMGGEDFDLVVEWEDGVCG